MELTLSRLLWIAVAVTSLAVMLGAVLAARGPVATRAELPGQDAAVAPRLPTVTVAQPGRPLPLTERADDTWQTDGRVEHIAYVGDRVYLVGQFEHVLDRAGNKTPRRYAAAFDAATGALLDWNPAPDERVRAVVPDASGSTLYLAGHFKTVGGQPRSRRAAVDADTGDPTPWRPALNAQGRAVVPSPDGQTVYLAGAFTTVNGQPRSRLAAVRADDGTLLPWAPSVVHADREAATSVGALALSSDGGAVYVGGTFTSVDGKPRHGVASVDPETGDLLPWDAALQPYPEQEAQVYALAVAGDTVYLCGDFFAVGDVVGPNLAAVDAVTGKRREWAASTDGGVNACAASATHLFIGGHFDHVGGWNADPKTNDEPTGTRRRHLAALELTTAAVDDWDPEADSAAGVYAVAVTPGRLAVGGDFTKVGADQSEQRGFAQFSGRRDSDEERS